FRNCARARSPDVASSQQNAATFSCAYAAISRSANDAKYSGRMGTKWVMGVLRAYRAMLLGAWRQGGLLSHWSAAARTAMQRSLNVAVAPAFARGNASLLRRCSLPVNV